MVRWTSLLRRIAAVCALVLVGALVVPGAAQAAVPRAGELSYACALKSNGLLRAVTSPTSCNRNETLVRVKPGPVVVCVQAFGSARLASPTGQCGKTFVPKTLPPAAGTVYFCADTGSGRLRYVTGPGLCFYGEVQLEVTPADAAPRVVSTTPADGATRIGTTVAPTVTFSEPVTAAASAFTFVCAGTDVPFALSGSGTATLTLTPTGALPVATACTVTVSAAGVSDVDTLDPPDHPDATTSFSFTTDAPPSLVSSTPTAGATGVAVASDIVLTFSEPVTVAPGAFTLTCGTTTLPYAVRGSGTAVVTVDPTDDLPSTATCSLTAPAASITDVDAGDPPDALTAPISIGFTTPDAAPTVTSTTPAADATGRGLDDGGHRRLLRAGHPHRDGLRPLVRRAAGRRRRRRPSTRRPSASPRRRPCRSAPRASPSSTRTGSATSTPSTRPTTWRPTTPSASASTHRPPSPARRPPTARPASPSARPLTVTFSEPVTVTTASFTLGCGSTSVPFTVSGSGTASVTLTPTAELPGTASCTLTVVAAQVHDVDAGDPPDTMTADVTATFTTVDAAPAVVSIAPAANATDVEATTAVVITFTEPVTADAGAVTLACPTGTPVSAVLTGGGTDTLTLTPASPLPVGAVCTVTVTAGGIHDVDTIDPPDTLAAGVTSTFTVAAVVNHAPTDLALSGSTVAENRPVGTVVGALSTTDADAGDTFTYSLVTGAGATDNAAFTIVGDSLRTAAVFDYEAKSSYSVRVRTTDAAGASVEKAFTITVTDVNEAPTDITLSGTTVAENVPLGTVVGALGVVDPDTGQTPTFAVVTTGCGGTYADGSAFGVSNGSLVTAGPLDYEAKSTYSICVRVTDGGSPALTLDTVFTITVTNVNEAPTPAGNTYTGVIGNTVAVLGVTVSGPSTSLTGANPLANDTDPEGDSITAVPGTVSTSGGGTATINADGTFRYLPGVGDVSQTDTFTYTVTDGSLTSTATISVVIGADRVWWVDGNATSTGDGRSTSPFATLTPLNGAGGAGDVDGPNDYLFVYNAPTAYAGGLVLEANQRLHGQRFGLDGRRHDARGSGLDRPDDHQHRRGRPDPRERRRRPGRHRVRHLRRRHPRRQRGDRDDRRHRDRQRQRRRRPRARGRRLRHRRRRSADLGERRSIGRREQPHRRHDERHRGDHRRRHRPRVQRGCHGELHRGPHHLLRRDVRLLRPPGAAPSPRPTRARPSRARRPPRSPSTTRRSAAPGLTFRSVSANGAPNGIRLNATGAVGGLTVLGNGSTAVGGNASGGTITNTTGPGVSLAGTRGVSLTNLTVTNTPNASGIQGTGVVGFTFANGTVSGSGSAATGGFGSNIAFDGIGDGISNVSGAVSVRGSTLSGGYNHGLTIYNNAGVISSLTVTGNTITSPATFATSIGSGVLVQSFGSASVAPTITTGSISGNTIVGFPGGSGIRVTAGNVTSLTAPVSQIGTSSAHFAIDGNQVHGFSAAVPMSTEAIIVLGQGRGTSYVDVTNNGSAASPVGLTQGDGISVNATWQHNLTMAVTGNVIAPGVTGVVSNRGITGGAAAGSTPTGATDSAVLSATISNNTISQTRGNGIYVIANQRGTLQTAVQNNTVAAPTLIGAGIRIDSSTSSAGIQGTTVCARVTGNTTAGLAPNLGISLRKQGTDPAVNRFGIVGLSPSPTTADTQTTSYVAGQNPGSVGGVLLVSAQTGFTSCTLPF